MPFPIRIPEITRRQVKVALKTYAFMQRMAESDMVVMALQFFFQEHNFSVSGLKRKVHQKKMYVHYRNKGKTK